MRHFIVMFMLVAAVACTRQEYVYLYDCAGHVSKFDLDTRTKIGEWRAAQIAGLSDVVPLPVRDGCTLNNVQYNAAEGLLAAIVPKSAVMTSEDTQHYTLLTIRIPAMRVIGHVELPPSGTVPNLVASGAHQLLVGYEVPTQNGPNKAWVARYDTATLKPVGRPEVGALSPANKAEQTLPKEIPLPDKFTYPVFADR